MASEFLRSVKEDMRKQYHFRQSDRGLLAWVSVASVFPQDPAGVDVIDRAFFRTYTDGEELVLYITLFKHEEIGTIKIDEYLDGVWRTVCMWNPKNFGDEFMLFDLISVLSICDLGGTVQVS